jgi:hypothetical protein
MAVGDLITGNPGLPQYEWLGQLMGSGTDWVVEKVKGLIDLPDVKSGDVERDIGAGWGDFPGVVEYKARYIEFDLKIRADTVAGIEGYINTAKSIFLATKMGQLVYQRPNGSKLYAWARPDKMDFESSYDVAHRLYVGSVRLKCANPRIYALAEVVTTLTIPNTLNTITGNVTNNGTVDASPILEIDYPCTNPRIINAADANRSIKIDVVLTAGQTLVIDTKNMVATIAGSIVATRSDNQWWHLKPGVNSITYNRSGGGASSPMRVRVHDTYM